MKKTTTTKAAVATTPAVVPTTTTTTATTTTTTPKPTTTKSTTTKSTTVKTTTTKTSAAPAIKTLAAGTSFVAGSISSTFRWQSSGILTSGCPQGVDGLAIKTCYHAHLDATGMLQSTKSTASRARDWDAEEDAAMYDDHIDSYFEAFPEQLDAIHADVERRSSAEGLALYKRQVASCSTSSPDTTNTTSPTNSSTPAVPFERQRIEMFSWPGVPAGQKWTYTWKSYQSVNTGVTSQYFHSWQLLRRDSCSGPIIGSDLELAADGSAVFAIADYVKARRCTGTGACPAVPLSVMLGKTLLHTVTVLYGVEGTFSYTVVDVANPATPLMTYDATGDMGASGSLKMGEYRRWNDKVTDADAFVGDYSAVRVV